MKYSNDTLLDEIRRATEELERPATYDYFNERDGPSSRLVETRFGAWTKAKRLAGVSNTGAYGKMPVNSDYFETVDTAEKAYWLGVLYGDGSIIDYEPHDRVYLGMTDREHVVKFKNAIDAEQSVCSKDDGSHVITITDQKIADDLIALGCDGDKTFSNTLPPLTDEALRAAFTRGLFDADGSFGGRGTWFTVRGANQERFKKLLEWLPCNGKVRNYDGTPSLLVSQGDGVFDLWAWLYSDGIETEPSLERKRENLPTEHNKWKTTFPACMMYRS